MSFHEKKHGLGDTADHNSATVANLNALISDLIATYGGVRDFGVGTLAQRPTASTANRFFYTTDEDILYLDNGVTWQAIKVNASSGNFVMPNESGFGIQIDQDSPAFGWRDILGPITVRGAGGNDPVWALFRTNIYAYQLQGVNDEIWITYHMPHDYVPGSELYIHTHWGLDTADSTNSITWGFDATFVNRDDITPDAFPATTNKTITHDCSAINVPQYGHVVSEVQLTDGSGQLGGNAIEIDGLILTRVYLSADAGNIDPFLFTADLHYQSTNLATKNKAPNFYYSLSSSSSSA
jgi:hypothetical protein